MQEFALLFTSLLFIIVALRLGYETGVSDGYERALQDIEEAPRHIRY